MRPFTNLKYWGFMFKNMLLQKSSFFLSRRNQAAYPRGGPDAADAAPPGAHHPLSNATS